LRHNCLSPQGPSYSNRVLSGTKASATAEAKMPEYFVFLSACVGLTLLLSLWLWLDATDIEE
jgi:hypothetical protein